MVLLYTSYWLCCVACCCFFMSVLFHSRQLFFPKLIASVPPSFADFVLSLCGCCFNFLQLLVSTIYSWFAGSCSIVDGLRSRCSMMQLMLVSCCGCCCCCCCRYSYCNNSNNNSNSKLMSLLVLVVLQPGLRAEPFLLIDHKRCDSDDTNKNSRKNKNKKQKKTNDNRDKTVSAATAKATTKKDDHVRSIKK